MELTVYRQASKSRPDGTIVYKGEDARPYVDGQIFFVADGMGGSAAIYHQKIVPEIFEEEKLMDTLFKGVYEDYSNETFVKYVIDSFYELFAVKHCYKDNIYNVKKSGYFASRIVTAIVLHETIYSEKYKAEKLFEALDACESDDDKKAYLDGIGKHFKELIQTKMRQIAKNANLIYESSFSGLALLGTTLCTTIYLEKESSVEAIYLVAGDSRPYAWTEKDGLSQVLDDQEGNDGGMTNYIKANEGTEFAINCDHFIFEKPCVLFNASDGCFDSGKFISQMAFEKLIIDAAEASDNTDGMSEYLTSFFLDYGRHDDSSTIAMKLFGYDGFEGFKTACVNRAAVLKTEYFDKMEDLLETNYISAREECERVFPKQLASLKESFSHEQGVRDYCSKYIKTGEYKPYLDKLSVIDGKIAHEKQYIEAAKEVIADAVASNYAKFKGFVDLGENWSKKHNISKVDDIEDKSKEMEREYLSRIQKCKDELDGAVDTIKSLLDSVCKIGVPDSFEDYNGIDFRTVEDSEKTINILFDILNGLRSKKLDVIRKLMARREDYSVKNRALAEKYPADIKMIADLIARGKIDISEMDINKDDKLKIENQLSVIKDVNENISKMEAEGKASALSEASISYWNSNYVNIILAVLDDPKYDIDEALKEKAETIINEFKDKTDGLNEKCETQKALFEKYDAGYYVRGRNSK